MILDHKGNPFNPPKPSAWSTMPASIRQLWDQELRATYVANLAWATHWKIQALRKSILG